MMFQIYVSSYEQMTHRQGSSSDEDSSSSDESSSTHVLQRHREQQRKAVARRQAARAAWKAKQPKPARPWIFPQSERLQLLSQSFSQKA